MSENSKTTAAPHETPIYMHLLIAFGMIITSGFIIGLIFSLNIFSYPNNSQFMVLGIVFITISATMLYAGKKDGLNHIAFYIICALSLWSSGVIFFFIGLEPDSVLRVASIFIIISLPIYILTQQKLLGFLSVLTFFILLNISIYFDKYDNQIGGMGLQLMFILQVLAVGGFIYFRELERRYEPVFYALITSLCIGAFYMIYSVTFSAYYSKPAIYAVNVVSVAFAAGLIALIIWAFDGFQKKYAEQMALAIAGVLILTTRLDPGMILAISLMVLGYKRQEARISILGMVLMPVVITFYYYSLHITLFEKSMHLLAGGGLLLAGSAYMKLRGWVGQEKSAAIS